jgi:uncharacterized membrane protein YqjE
MQTHTRIEPDARISDLIGRLTDDSKRLVAGEVRLAKIEVKESAKLGVRGVLWLSMAFGVSVIAMVALTIFIAAGVGRLVGGHVYVGALVAGVLEVAAAASARSPSPGTRSPSRAARSRRR